MGGGTTAEQHQEEIKEATSIKKTVLASLLQTGFTLLEAGYVTSKNTANILFKNLHIIVISATAYLLVGFQLAFGRGNSFSGMGDWTYGLADERLVFWLFQFAFAATAATIVSGSMAERCAFNAYLICSVMLSGGGVKLCLNFQLAAQGFLILLFGFLAFNGGFQASISHEVDAVAIAKVVFNTAISASSGGIAVLLMNHSRRESLWSFLMALNGSLAGMCTCILGFLSLSVKLINISSTVYDPLDAVAVHMGGGLWGLVAVALFQDGGIVYGGSAEVLAWNIVGALAIVAWSGGLCLVMFGSLRLLGVLRVPPDMEIAGMDLLKHREPADAWLESQYDGSINAQNKRNSDLLANMSAPEKCGGTNFQNPIPPKDGQKCANRSSCSVCCSPMYPGLPEASHFNPTMTVKILMIRNLIRAF
ncbi:putative ammonium transporter 1 [Procambarus clarkii]|uniref:putative ammonium transporter 1 n=1 Tax=Procambarus clarkii TaxID=6728 RepID=UPI003743E0D8